MEYTFDIDPDMFGTDLSNVSQIAIFVVGGGTANNIYLTDFNLLK